MLRIVSMIVPSSVKTILARLNLLIRDGSLAISVILVIFFGLPASPQTRTIKIVVPTPPGGVADTVARLLGDQIGRSRAQTILIENRAGAGGMIAAEAVSRTPPDGNTLLIMYPDVLIPPHLRKLNFDLLDGFEPICELVSAPVVIVVNGASRYRTLADLIGAARARIDAGCVWACNCISNRD